MDSRSVRKGPITGRSGCSAASVRILCTVALLLVSHLHVSAANAFLSAVETGAHGHPNPVIGEAESGSGATARTTGFLISFDHDLAPVTFESGATLFRDQAAPTSIQKVQFLSRRDTPAGSALAVKGGYEIYALIASTAVLVLGGLILVLLTNIGRRKRAEEALRLSEQRLRAIIDHSPAAIYLKDTEGCYLEVNREYLRRYGATTESVIGRKAYAFLPYELAKRVEDHDRTVLESRAISRREMDIRYADGTEHTHIVVKFPIFGPNEEITAIGCVSTDITDRKEAEEQARLLQGELAHVSRLSTMGEMAAGFAHELNQPLAAINNYAQGCLRRLRGGEREPTILFPALIQIGEQAERAGAIIRRIRRFVQKNDTEKSEIDVNAAIRGAAALLNNEALQSGTRIRLNLDSSLPKAMADVIQIQQVVVNLARNAMEAMSSTDAQTRELTIETALSADGRIGVAVHDTGPGMPKANADRVFDPFFTTKRDGMGMGLSICRSIVEAHGGTLSGRSNDGDGTTFRFSLPAASSDATMQPA